MNADYKIHPERELVEVRYWGQVTPSTVLSLFGAVLEDPEWSPSMNLFVDLSRVEAIDINFNQMMGITHRKAPYLSQGRASHLAIWAPDDINFGSARMYAALMAEVDGVTTDVFRDRSEASDFIGIPVDEGTDLN